MDDVNEKEGKESKIIQELITHVNALESKISSLEESISEANDLQTVNKLDIINMKNELDKIKMVFPSVSHEQIEKMQEISKLVDSESLKELGDFEKKIKDTYKNMELLHQRLASLEESSTFPHGLMNEIEEIKSRLASLPHAPKKQESMIKETQRLLSQLKTGMSEFDSLKRKIEKPGHSHAPEKSKARPMPNEIKQLRADVSNLKLDLQSARKARPGLRHAPDPRIAAMEKSISEMKSEFRGVRERISGLKPVKVPENIMELDTLKEEISRLLPLSSEISSLKREIKSSPKELQKSLGRISSKIALIESASKSQAKRIAEISKTLPQLRKEIAASRKAATESAKKETVSFILKELKGMMR